VLLSNCCITDCDGAVVTVDVGIVVARDVTWRFMLIVLVLMLALLLAVLVICVDV